MRVGGICLDRKYLEPFDDTRFGKQDLEAQAVDFEQLASTRHMPHGMGDEAANGVEAVFLRLGFVGGEDSGLEGFFNSVYGGVTADAKTSVYERVDFARIVLLV